MGKAVKITGIVAGTMLGLYALTVAAVWGVACIVDLRTGEDLEEDDDEAVCTGV